MKYEYWPDEEEAKLVENLLVDELTSIAKHTPAVRKKAYETLFEGIENHLNVFTTHDESVIYQNINPFLKIFNKGDHKVFRTLTGDNLPLCSDGLFCKKNVKLKDRPYEVFNLHLPSASTSISILGKSSPLMSISDAKSLTILTKGYCKDNWGQLSNALREQLSDPEFDFSNMFVWMDTLICSYFLVENFVEQSGLKTLLNNPNDVGQHDIEGLISKINNDAVKRNRIELLDSIFSKDQWAVVPVYELFYLKDMEFSKTLRHQTLARRFEIVSTVISSVLEKDVASMRLSWAQTYHDMLLDSPERKAIGKSLATLFTYPMIKDHIRPKKALELSRFLDMPELIEKASNKHKGIKLSEDLGL